jgi:trans-aconitate 2-methyltransferase
MNTCSGSRISRVALLFVAIALWNPQQYEKFKDQRSQPFFDLLANVLPRPDMSVVDLGCGTGELTIELHRRLKARETIGIDSSEDMLARARAIVPDSIVDATLKFEKQDIEKWKPKQKFDLVFSNAAIQWCDDHKTVFAKMKGMLSDEGQIAVQMPFNQDFPTHAVAREMAAEIAPDFTIQDSMLSLEEYSSILYRLGFKNQNAFVKVYGHELESREGVVEWVKGSTLTPFKKRLTTKKYDSFLKEYERRLFSEIKDERPFFFTFKRILLWARL